MFISKNEIIHYMGGYTQMDGNTMETKFCRECGAKIAKKAVICPHCGCQVEDSATSQPQIVINNSNQNQNINNAGGTSGKQCSKWTSFFLCLFLGCVGGHKFYEGKVGTGILYIFTCGLFGIGALIDLFNILGKPDPYTV